MSMAAHLPLWNWKTLKNRVRHPPESVSPVLIIGCCDDLNRVDSPHPSTIIRQSRRADLNRSHRFGNFAPPSPCVPNGDCRAVRKVLHVGFVGQQQAAERCEAEPSGGRLRTEAGKGFTRPFMAGPEMVWQTFWIGKPQRAMRVATKNTDDAARKRRRGGKPTAFAMRPAMSGQLRSTAPRT